ncbi:hypothetical protein HKCCE2091_13310 [Rhodobacterales bacterium HKCCE2091]|nr:hypothetical protein [Rhodobacterales bacterium HKCCE2091]
MFPLPLPARLVLGAAATAVVVGCAATAAPPLVAQAHAPSGVAAPVDCALEVQRTRNGLVYEGVVTARVPADGVYSIHLGGPATSLNQGGHLRLARNETARVGRITVAGQTNITTAEMEVSIAGTTRSCPLR